jgi:hypothetical protein
MKRREYPARVANRTHAEAREVMGIEKDKNGR